MTRIVRPLEIINMRITDTPEIRRYSLCANGHEIKVDVTMKDINEQPYEKLMKAINDRFLASLQYIKHTGGFPRGLTLKKIEKELNKWSTTDTGIAIKPKNDTVKEFRRFT